MLTPQKRRSRLCFLSFLLIAVCPAILSAETMYVKSSGTKAMKEESADSKVVQVLDQGTAVDVAQKSDKFYKVGLPGGGEGWIFKFKLTSDAPSDAGGSGDTLDILGGKQKIAARESGSDSSIRGLSPVSEKHAQSKGISPQNIQAVKQMENFRVGQEEMEKFLQEGRLGEYAK